MYVGIHAYYLLAIYVLFVTLLNSKAMFFLLLLLKEL
jgi:hypothetical protein